jgi:hypothetical protein
MSGAEFILNKNVGSKDVLHKYPSFESCNVDDAKDKQHIDAETADALIAMREVELCKHCWPNGR